MITNIHKEPLEGDREKGGQDTYLCKYHPCTFRRLSRLTCHSLSHKEMPKPNQKLRSPIGSHVGSLHPIAMGELLSNESVPVCVIGLFGFVYLVG